MMLLSVYLLSACGAVDPAETSDSAAPLDAATDTGAIGGECTYVYTHGTCTFIDATGGAAVTFEFVSDDGTVTDTDQLYVGDGGTPPTQACLDALGIAPGVAVGCAMGTIVTGACSPTYYTFDGIDLAACAR